MFNILFKIMIFIFITVSSQATTFDSIYNYGKVFIDDMVIMRNVDENKVLVQTEDEEFVEKKWDDLFEKIVEAEETFTDMSNAPKSAIFSADKTSLRKDLDKELSEILYFITEKKAALRYLKIVRQLKEKITKEKSKISKLKEGSLLSNNDSDQKSYEDKIALSKENIIHYNENIEKVKDALMFNLSSAGVNFNSEQLTVLLSRVDVNDIVKLTLVYNSLKVITTQLGKLMDATKEDMRATKKYYSMFVILSEMVVYIQKQYINKMNKIYIPKIEKIIRNSKIIVIRTKNLIRETKDVSKKIILENNLRNQLLSLKTANLYRQNLIDQLDQIKIALNKSLLDLKIALNTFKTVEISFSLLEIIQESQKSFESLINIQLPKIIPFENTLIQDEYNKITEKISQ